MSISCCPALIRRSASVLLASAALFQSVTVWIALCGTSATAVAVLTTSLTLAASLSQLVFQRIFQHQQRSVFKIHMAAAVAVAAAAGLPAGLASSFGWSAAWGEFSLPVAIFAYSVPALLVCCTLAILWSIAAAFDVTVHSCRGVWALQSLLMAGGVCLAGLIGVSPLMLMVLAAGVSLFCELVFVASPQASKAIESIQQPVFIVVSDGWLHICSGLLTGLLTAVLLQFWGLLLPPHATQTTLLISAAAAMLMCAERLLRVQGLQRMIRGAGIVAALSFAWLAPGITLLFLGISGEIQAEWLRCLARSAAAGGISAVLLLPAGFLLRSSSSGGRESVIGWAWTVGAGALAGVCLCILVPSARLLPLVLAATAVLAFAQLWQADFRGFTVVRRWRVSAVCCLALLTVPLCAPQFDIHTASRLVFSSRTYAARSRGVAAELIRHTEPARQAAVSTGVGGELAVWRNSAAGVEILRSGIVTARASSDTRISPQSPEEVLPAILGLCNHLRPGRVLLLGDDSGAVLRTCTHFPVQQIVAVRTDTATTAVARKYLWEPSPDRPDLDERVRLQHSDLPLAVRNQQLGQFDVVVVAGGPGVALRHASLMTREFYGSVRRRLLPDGVFCQRLSLQNPGPEMLRQVLATLSSEFQHVGAIQTVHGEFVLLASDAEAGLVHPQLLDHLQRTHVQQEAASCGWDWAQIAVLPMVLTEGDSGLFAKSAMPVPLSAGDAAAVLNLTLPSNTAEVQSERLRTAFAPFQKQIASAMPPGEAHEEAKRRLASLQQQVEILAGMPDQPWTYRRSLRMEMQRSPRPPVEHVEGGKIIRSTHPLDERRQDYFVTLGKALQSVQNRPERSLAEVQQLSRLADAGEPLLGWFSHYEIVRLYELLEHPDPADELRHRLHLVFFAAPSDASVRPAISALQMLVDRPQLIEDPAARYDQFNAVLQKLIERWEARTAWEPRSATRVQQDVDLSVLAGRRALEQMEQLSVAAGIPAEEFRQRRQFVHEALISPLRTYCEQVLAHRMKTETPAAASGTEDPDDMPLLAPGLSTN